MGSSTDAALVPSNERQLMDELVDLCAEFAPRRLALCALAPSLDDAVVIGWGMAFPDQVLTYLQGPPGSQPVFASFASMESATARLTRHGDVRLVWVDPEPIPDR
jgi:hypothetical protein